MSNGMKPTSWRIDLKEDSATRRYVPDPFDTGEIRLKQGDLVFWKLDPPPPISSAQTLRFTTVDGSHLPHPLGPFTRIDQLVKEEEGKMVLHELVASGFNGTSGVFSYEIQSLGSGESPSSSQPTLNIAISASDPPSSNETQQITVSIELPSSGYPRLKALPEKLSIRPGQHAVWNFKIPFDLFPEQVWVPVVRFVESPLGPFTTQTSFVPVSRHNQDQAQPRSIQLIFSGRQMLAKVPSGSHEYTVAIETPMGTMVASGDPAIDDDGDVMPAPPTG